MLYFNYWGKLKYSFNNTFLVFQLIRKTYLIYMWFLETIYNSFISFLEFHNYFKAVETISHC